MQRCMCLQANLDAENIYKDLNFCESYFYLWCTLQWMDQIFLCILFLVVYFFYMMVIAELFQIAESTADWKSPKTLQNISTSSYFSISKCHIIIAHCRNLTRKFWYFLGCKVHQPIESNAGIKEQLSFPWNLGQLMCNWKKKREVSPILRHWVLSLKFKFVSFIFHLKIGI